MFKEFVLIPQTSIPGDQAIEVRNSYIRENRKRQYDTDTERRKPKKRQ